MADDEGRYGVGLAMPFGFASNDLKQATGTRLLEFDLGLEVATKLGELPYDMKRGSRLHMLKHVKVSALTRKSMASHLMQEAMKGDGRVRTGETRVEQVNGETLISTDYTERRYDGTGGQGTIDYEAPA